MKQIAFAGFFTFLIGKTFCQTPVNMKDTATANIIMASCDEKIFTHTETLPGYKTDKKQFEDSLYSSLKPFAGSISVKTTAYSFFLTKDSKVSDVRKIFGDYSIENPVKKALEKFSYMLEPAKQNSYKVCSINKLHIHFIENGLMVDITQ